MEYIFKTRNNNSVVKHLMNTTDLTSDLLGERKVASTSPVISLYFTDMRVKTLFPFALMNGFSETFSVNGAMYSA